MRSAHDDDFCLLVSVWCRGLRFSFLETAIIKIFVCLKEKFLNKVRYFVNDKIILALEKLKMRGCF